MGYPPHSGKPDQLELPAGIGENFSSRQMQFDVALISMADTFDPYHKWLGISPKDQPPHYYRLLGIELFETDPDVIESAADQRMAHVRTFQSGRYSALSQQILNELSAAKICLLHPAQRTAYDELLHTKLAALEPTPATPSPAPAVAAPAAPAAPAIKVAVAVTPRVERSQPRSPATGTALGERRPIVIASVAGLCLVFVTLAALVFMKSSDSAAPNVARAPDVASPPHDSTSPTIDPASTKTTPNDTNPTAPPPLPTSPAAMASSNEESAQATNDDRLPGEQALARLNELGAKLQRDGNRPGGPIIHINLSRTAVRDEDLKLLPALPELKGLLLDATQITDLGLRELEPLVGLESLALRETPITDDGLRWLEKLTRLNWLDLADVAQVGDAGAEHLAHLTELRLLNAGKTRITDRGARYLRSLVNLEWLCLQGTPITDEGLAQLTNLPVLKTLLIHDLQIGDATLGRLSTASRLETLDVRNTRVTAAGVASLKLRLPKLDLAASPDVMANAPQPIPPPAAIKTMPPGPALPPPNSLAPEAMVRKLGGSVRQNLKLPDRPLAGVRIENDQMSDDDLAFLEQLPLLSSLELAGGNLTDKALAHVRPLESLTSLTIDRARLTDDGLEQLSALRQLTKLKLTHAPITDAALKHLSRLDELESLDLSATEVTGSGLGQLRTTRLRTLVLDETNVTDKTIAAVARLTSLETLSLKGTAIGNHGLLRLRNVKSLKTIDVSQTAVNNEAIQQFKRGHKGSINIRNRTAAPVARSNQASPRPASPTSVIGQADPVPVAGQTKIVGTANNPVFTERAAAGGLLVGFEVSTEPAFGSEILKTVRPIFRTASGRELLGQVHGTKSEKLATAKARPGYAVGGIIVKAGLFVDGFSIVFMRVNGDSLDPKDAYESDWLGGTGGDDKVQIGGTGAPVIGIIGRADQDHCSGLGLLMKQ